MSGLDPGKELKMVIYAANSKGRSDPVLLEGFTLKVAEKQTGKIYEAFFLYFAAKICTRLKDFMANDFTHQKTLKNIAFTELSMCHVQ